MCLSLVTGTPFLAVGSNSWKIEALLSEAGVDADRMLSAEQLAHLGPDDLDRPFSATELANIAAFLEHAQSSATSLFSQLGDLAKAAAA